MQQLMGYDECKRLTWMIGIVREASQTELYLQGDS
jgi:hypothetical protein